MEIEFDNNSPIYLQMLDYFRQKIISGQWPPGSRIDSVRDLALRFSVNPNTVQRALSELEREGLAVSERTSGRFITEDQVLIERLREDLAQALLRQFIKQMRELGLAEEQVSALLRRYWQHGSA